MSAPVIEARDVTKVFLRGEVEIEALRGVSTKIAVPPGPYPSYVTSS